MPPNSTTTKRPCLNATDAPHFGFPVLSHVKFLPTSLLIFFKTPWQLFPSQPLHSPPALAGAADEPRQPLGTVMEMTSQSVATLGLFRQGPGGGQVLTNVVETTSLSLKKQSETR